MAINFGSIGAVAQATTAAADVPYPNDVAAGDLLVLAVVNRLSTAVVTPPTGWTSPSGPLNVAASGSGAEAADAGQVRLSVFTKIATGAESGALAIAVPTAAAIVAVIIRYTTTLTSWETAAAQGADSTPGTAWAVTAGTDPDIDAGDLLLAITALNTDAYTHTAQAAAATGVTFGPAGVRHDTRSASGNDETLHITEHPVLTGPSSAAPTYAMTASGSTASAPTGVTIFLRLREIDDPATPTVPSIHDLAPITVAFWFRPGTVGTGYFLDFGQFAFYYDADKLYLFQDAATDGVWEWVWPATPVAGTWMHLAIVYQRQVAADQPLLYWNAVALGPDFNPSVAAGALASDAASPKLIGNRAALDDAADGTLDDFRIYNRALNIHEVHALYLIGVAQD